MLYTNLKKTIKLKNMKKSVVYLVTILFLTGMLFSSCSAVKNSNGTQRGALIGALGGAVLGGVIGNNVGGGGNGALGAVLGGVVGGLAGGVIGNKMDKQAREIQTSLPGATVERVGEGIKLVLGENAVRFDTNKATLTGKAKVNLDKLVKVFNDYPDTNVQIYGHTDTDGADEYNLNLSKQRAATVKTYLFGKGLVASRFVTNGVGESEPIVANDSKEGKSQNRRVEFAITANDKMVQDAQKQAGN
jgi:outer membrane protein OmpA-like peptidoglycan-associated protein